MSISITNLTSGDGGASPNTTASISPTNGAVVFAWVVWAVNTSHSVVSDSASGCGLTWTKVSDFIWGVRRRAFLYVGTGTPSSGQLTFSFVPSGGTVQDCLWIVDEATGLDATTPYGNVYDAAHATDTNVSISIAESPNAGDFVWSAMACETLSSTISINSELTNLTATVETGDNVRNIGAGYDSSPDSTPTPSFDYTPAGYSGIVALILNVASAPAVAVDQEGFRFRDDDGSESTASWKAAQDTDVVIGTNEQFRLRELLNATGNPDSAQYQIEAQRLLKILAHPAQADWSLESTSAIVPGTTGAWDDALWMSRPGPLIKIGSTYFLYYTGALYDDGYGDGTFRAIGVCTSTDGVNFTKYAGNPIITYTTTGFTEIEEGASIPTIYIDRTGTLHMWYGASKYYDVDQVDVDIRYRKSLDGYNWTNDTLVHAATGTEYIPTSPMICGNQWNLYVLGPLTSGYGALGRLYGSSPTDMPTYELINASNWRFGGSVNFLQGRDLYMLGLTASTNLYNYQTRTLDCNDPSTISNLVESGGFDPYYGPNINLDLDNELWRMFVLSVTGDAYDGHIRQYTAPFSWTDQEALEWLKIQ